MVNGRSLKGWVERLTDRDAAVRKEAALALGRFRDKGQAAVKPLIEALRDKDTGVRAAAAVSLNLIGPRGKEAVDLLIAALKEKDAGVRSVAALELARMGKEAVEPLIAALHDPVTRAPASAALARSGGAAVWDLGAALGDPDVAVRRLAVEILGQIGAPACVVLHHLWAAALLDRDSIVRDGAGRAIVTILGALAR
jgi:HEAT repeat protein